MGKEIVAVVIEKTYRPPPGAPDKYWCYLMVETETGDRENLRLHQKLHDKIVLGDKIAFSKPWRKNKRVRNIRIIETP
jgi:hypothetical protein